MKISTTPATIDVLGVADEMDVQVAIHTDTLNEAGFVEDSVGAFKGRAIHTFHTEGAGGACSRYNQGLRGTKRLAFFHQPHASLYREYDRRAFGYADGLSSFGFKNSGRRFFCRIENQTLDHCGRRHSPRPKGARFR